MQTKNLYIAVFLVLVLGVGAYAWYARAPKVAPYNEAASVPGMGKVAPTTDQDPFDTLITFTDEGYSPREVTIKKGARVRFANTSQTETWPASAIHPTHSLYPGKEVGDCLGSAFDACTGVKSGYFYAFTFNYEGEWRYHDHLDASKTGIVVVTP